jgi:hypothetical protein
MAGQADTPRTIDNVRIYQLEDATPPPPPEAEEIGRLTVTDHAIGPFTTLSYVAPEAGRLIFQMKNPDGSADGRFSVYAPITIPAAWNYLGIVTSITDSGFDFSGGIPGLTETTLSYDVEAGPIDLRLDYDGDTGIDNAGIDEVVVYFVPQPIEVQSASLLGSFSPPAGQEDHVSFVVVGPGELVVDVTDADPSGQGALVYYLDGVPFGTTYTNPVALLTEPFRVSLPIDEGSHTFKLGHEYFDPGDISNMPTADVWFVQHLPFPLPPTENTIAGTNGDNLLIGTVLADEIQGYDGIDWVEGREGNDVLFGGPDVDVLKGGRGDDHILGGEDGDHLYGNAGSDVLYGEGGDDAFRGANGHDTLHGGDGDDLVSGNSGDDALFGNAGADTVLGGPGNDTAQGGAGDDEILGNGGNDQLFGDAGNDMLKAGSGNDIVDGGAGDDTIVGNKGADQLFGGAGDDVLRGVDGDDMLSGGAGDDRLFGGSGADMFVIGGSSLPQPEPPSSELDWVQWEVAEGGNGHWYAAVYKPEGIFWADSREEAEGLADGATLATVTSHEENLFIMGLVQDDERFWVPWDSPGGGLGPWLGGFQDSDAREPDGDWQWVTGEQWNYDAWSPHGGQPDNAGRHEDFLQYAGAAYSTRWEWNDRIETIEVPGYVAEFTPAALGAASEIGETDTIADFTPGEDVLDLTALGIPDLDTLGDVMTGNNGGTEFDLSTFGGPNLFLADINPITLDTGDFLL